MGKTRHRKWYDEDENFYQKRRNKKQKKTNQTHRQHHLDKKTIGLYPDEEERSPHAHLSVPQQRNR